VHVLSHVLHYGSGVFEGIRAYATDRGPAVFRLMDHLRRLERSSEIYFMDLPVRHRGAARRDARGDRGQRPRRLLQSGRWRSAATASSASTRSPARST
jgi:branched-subunit amino acid aminotransferase/4-amino-4-deoxychorismate lyase